MGNDFSFPLPVTYQNLYVSRLPAEMDDAGLMALFAPLGGVARTKVMIDTYTKVSKRFGFVLFQSDACGRAAHNYIVRLKHEHYQQQQHQQHHLQYQQLQSQCSYVPFSSSSLVCTANATRYINLPEPSLLLSLDIFPSRHSAACVFESYSLHPAGSAGMPQPQQQHPQHQPPPPHQQLLLNATQPSLVATTTTSTTSVTTTTAVTTTTTTAGACTVYNRHHHRCSSASGLLGVPPAYAAAAAYTTATQPSTTTPATTTTTTNNTDAVAVHPRATPFILAHAPAVPATLEQFTMPPPQYDAAAGAAVRASSLPTPTQWGCHCCYAVENHPVTAYKYNSSSIVQSEAAEVDESRGLDESACSGNGTPSPCSTCSCATIPASAATPLCCRPLPPAMIFIRTRRGSAATMKIVSTTTSKKKASTTHNATAAKNINASSAFSGPTPMMREDPYGRHLLRVDNKFISGATSVANFDNDDDDEQRSVVASSASPSAPRPASPLVSSVSSSLRSVSPTIFFR